MQTTTTSSSMSSKTTTPVALSTRFSTVPTLSEHSTRSSICLKRGHLSRLMKTMIHGTTFRPSCLPQKIIWYRLTPIYSLTYNRRFSIQLFSEGSLKVCCWHKWSQLMPPIAHGLLRHQCQALLVLPTPLEWPRPLSMGPLQLGLTGKRR